MLYIIVTIIFAILGIKKISELKSQIIDLNIRIINRKIYVDFLKRKLAEYQK